jgi:hypothetical protein
MLNEIGYIMILPDKSGNRVSILPGSIMSETRKRFPMNLVNVEKREDIVSRVSFQGRIQRQYFSIAGGKSRGVTSIHV